MPPTEQQLKEFLYKALDAPIGIKLTTDDVQRLIQKLHTARRKSNDEALSVLVIAISRTSPDSEVWIVKQPQERTDAEEE